MLSLFIATISNANYLSSLDRSSNQRKYFALPLAQTWKQFQYLWKQSRLFHFRFANVMHTAKFKKSYAKLRPNNYIWQGRDHYFSSKPDNSQIYLVQRKLKLFVQNLVKNEARIYWWFIAVHIHMYIYKEIEKKLIEV